MNESVNKALATYHRIPQDNKKWTFGSEASSGVVGGSKRKGAFLISISAVQP